MVALVLIPFSNACFLLVPGLILFLFADDSGKLIERTKKLLPLAVALCMALLAYLVLFKDDVTKRYMLVYWSSEQPAFLFRQNSVLACLSVLARQAFGTLLVHFGALSSVLAVGSTVPFGLFSSSRICGKRVRNAVWCLIVAPILLHVAASAAKQYPFAPRFLLYSFPGVLLMSAMGVDFISGKFGKLAGYFVTVVEFLAISVFLSEFPVKRHEIVGLFSDLAPRTERAVPVVVHSSLFGAWTFYRDYTSKVPDEIRKVAVAMPRLHDFRLSETTCPFPSCPNRADAKWWLMLGYGENMNIVPRAFVNYPLYWLHSRNGTKTFQNAEDRLVAHLKDCHGLEVARELHERGASAYLFKR